MKTKSYEAAIWRVALGEITRAYNGEYGETDYDGREWIKWVYGKTYRTVANDIKKLRNDADLVVRIGAAKAKKLGVEVVTE